VYTVNLVNTMKSQIARDFIGQVSNIDQCHSASLALSFSIMRKVVEY